MTIGADLLLQIVLLGIVTAMSLQSKSYGLTVTLSVHKLDVQWDRQ